MTLHARGRVRRRHMVNVVFHERIELLENRRRAGAVEGWECRAVQPAGVLIGSASTLPELH